MVFELYFTKEAEDTFKAICDQIESSLGQTELNKFKEKTLNSLESLRISPFVYPLTSSKYPLLRKYIFHKNCSIFYKVFENNVVHIICFWDNRQEPMF